MKLRPSCGCTGIPCTAGAALAVFPPPRSARIGVCLEMPSRHLLRPLGNGALKGSRSLSGLRRSSHGIPEGGCLTAVLQSSCLLSNQESISSPWSMGPARCSRWNGSSSKWPSIAPENSSRAAGGSRWTKFASGSRWADWMSSRWSGQAGSSSQTFGGSSDFGALVELLMRGKTRRVGLFWTGTRTSGERVLHPWTAAGDTRG